MGLPNGQSIQTKDTKIAGMGKPRRGFFRLLFIGRAFFAVFGALHLFFRRWVGWLLGENLDECRDFGMGSVPRLVWEAGS